MKTLKQLDREACRLLREAIETALAPLEKEFNVKVKLGRGTFDASTFGLKVETCLVVDGKVKTREADAFGFLAPSVGLPADALGKQIKMGGKLFEVIGFRAKSWKKPIEIREVGTDKVYITSVEALKRALGLPIAAEGGAV